MNILTVFAGRRCNIEILRKYLQKALLLKIIDEVHFWNNTRNSQDEEYLKTISNLKRTSSTGAGNYILVNTIISNNSFNLNVKANNDIHVKITNLHTEYEIVLGAYDNLKCLIRENNNVILTSGKSFVANIKKYDKFSFIVSNDTLNIMKNNKLIISQRIQPNFEIKTIHFKTGHKSVGHLTYDTPENKGFYFMDTCEKSWKNYYTHYHHSQFRDDIILKCDDDIVFIDLYKLPKFISFIRNTHYDLVFANTINNGVSAYYQQNKYNLIPKELMNLEYPRGGAAGSLWESGLKAETLHDYFIENNKKFLDYQYDGKTIPINTRYSINFFGYKGSHWAKIKDAYPDDEKALTINYVRDKGFKNILYTDFYVSHLSFYRQIETGINLSKLVSKYDALFHTIEESGRFENKEALVT